MHASINPITLMHACMECIVSSLLDLCLFGKMDCRCMLAVHSQQYLYLALYKNNARIMLLRDAFFFGLFLKLLAVHTYAQAVTLHDVPSTSPSFRADTSGYLQQCRM